jgi:hypothetical protein
MNRQIGMTWLAAFAVGWAASSAVAGEMGSAVIKGRVVYEGTPPKPKAIKMTGDQHCMTAHTKPVPAQGTIVYTKDGNAIPYTFVYIKSGINDKYDPPGDPIVLNQHNCTYEPHVFGMVAGQGMNIVNSDPTNHNIHSLAKKNPAFNFAQPSKDMVKELRGNDTFTKPEVMVKIKCDVHAWMSTYCGVMTHPFFDVTKDHLEAPKGQEAQRGAFSIEKLPAGEYEVAAWHETFGEVKQKVTVADGETKEIVFKMGSGAKAEAPAAREVILGSENKS